MKLYKKPVIILDTGMAEGIYAASGASPVKYLSTSQTWPNGGTNIYSIDLSSLNPSQLTVVLTFNMNISGGWGGGASSTINGKDLTLSWYSAPTNAEINVQVQGADIKQLECTNFTYSNN